MILGLRPDAVFLFANDHRF